MTISLIIPIYNGQTRVNALIDELDEAIHQYPRLKEVIIVNDGSSDNTAKRLKKYSRPWLRIVSLQQNARKGGAIAAGVKKVSQPYCFFTDADLPYDLSALQQGVSALENGAQMVAGSRHHSESSSTVANPNARALSSRIFSRLVNLVLDEPVADTQCGFKGFTREAAQKLFAEQKIPGFCFDVELFARAQRAGMRVAFIPVHWKNNDETTVSLLRDSIRMMTDLLRLHILLRLRDGETNSSLNTHIPLLVGFSVALLAIPISISIGLWSWVAGLSTALRVALLVVWFCGLPLCALLGYNTVRLLPLGSRTSRELARYTLIGVFNTVFNTAIVDILMIVTGQSRGIFIVLFSVFAYVLTVTQSFVWNRFWIFSKEPTHGTPRAFGYFVAVVAASSLVSVACIHLLVNVIGAPAFFTQTQWANVAIVLTIPIAFFATAPGPMFLVLGTP